MDYATNMNLATIFRAHDAKLSLDHTIPSSKECLFEKKLTKLESHANIFLIDKKYASQLDELI